MAGFIVFVTAEPTVPGDLGQAHREGVSSQLSNAQLAVDVIGHCAEMYPRDGWEGSYQTLFSLLTQASVEAEDLYPGLDFIPEALESQVGISPPTCGETELRRMEIDARRTITEASRLMIIEAAARSSGLWFGNLRICGDRITRIDNEEPYIDGELRLAIRFSETIATRMHALTTARVGETVSVVLDGAIVAHPIVMEPIRNAVSLSLPQGLSAEDFRRAASAAC